MTKLAVATVNWNGQKDTLEFLKSFKLLDTAGLEVKIFLVSNEKILPEQTPFSLIFRPENRGSAGGYNDAARAALAWGADFILLVNNDILFKSSNLLKSLISVAEQDEKIGAVSPKILFAPGYEFRKKRYEKNNVGRVIWYAGGSFDWNNVNSVHRGLDKVDAGQYEITGETGFASGSAMLVKKEIFTRGIFWDEGLFAYFDDNDFQQKIRRAGFKLFYDGRSAVYHKVSRTSGIGAPTTDYYTARNRLIFSFRYAPLKTKLAVLRQELGWLLSGRPGQREGVKDFFIGKRGQRPLPSPGR